MQRIYNFGTSKKNNIYSSLLESSNTKSKIEIQNPNINLNIYSLRLKDPVHKSIIFRHIYGITPLGEYLIKYKIIEEIPNYTICKKGPYTSDYNSSTVYIFE